MNRVSTRRRSPRVWLLAALVAAVAVMTSSCSAMAAFGDSFNRAMQGESATITTFARDGQPMDSVHGMSVNFSRDSRFDTKSSDGTTNSDSSVVLISIGNSHMEHVGSTMIVAQDGLGTVAGPGKVTISNTQSGMPWLNDILEMNRNLWKGKAKIILIRSQNDVPLAVYAGNEVDLFATDIPKSTWFRVDGKNLLVYRANMTIYDADLFQS